MLHVQKLKITMEFFFYDHSFITYSVLETWNFIEVSSSVQVSERLTREKKPNTSSIQQSYRVGTASTTTITIDSSEKQQENLVSQLF